MKLTYLFIILIILLKCIILHNKSPLDKNDNIRCQQTLERIRCINSNFFHNLNKTIAVFKSQLATITSFEDYKIFIIKLAILVEIAQIKL